MKMAFKFILILLLVFTTDSYAQFGDGGSGGGDCGSGTVQQIGNCTSAGCFVDGTNNTMTFEGETDDEYELRISSEDQEQDTDLAYPARIGGPFYFSYEYQSAEPLDGDFAQYDANGILTPVTVTVGNMSGPGTTVTNNALIKWSSTAGTAAKSAFMTEDTTGKVTISGDLVVAGALDIGRAGLVSLDQGAVINANGGTPTANKIFKVIGNAATLISTTGDTLTAAGTWDFTGAAVSGIGAGTSGWTDGGTNVYNAVTTDKVGIGTTTPTSTLEIVKQTSTAPLMVSSTPTGDGDYLVVHSSGNVGIGTAVPPAKLYVVGTPQFTGLLNCDTIDTNAAGLLACGSDGGGGGGTPVVFDIGDDSGNDSASIAEIATSGDTNAIFSEPSADKLLITLSNDWPKADTADDLTCTNCIGPTEITDLTLGTDTAGNYAAGDAEAGAATSGDSATSFFSTGTIEDGRLPASMADKVITGSLAIPQGAAPTVNAAGETAVDTTDDQVLYYGSAERVLSYKNQHTAVITNLAAADDNMPLGTSKNARSILSVGCRCHGTCTTKATIALEDDGGTAMTHNTPTCASAGGAVTYISVTAANALTAGEGLRFDVTNTPSPETDTYEILFEDTETAQ